MCIASSIDCSKKVSCTMHNEDVGKTKWPQMLEVLRTVNTFIYISGFHISIGLVIMHNIHIFSPGLFIAS